MTGRPVHPHSRRGIQSESQIEDDTSVGRFDDDSEPATRVEIKRSSEQGIHRLAYPLTWSRTSVTTIEAPKDTIANDRRVSFESDRSRNAKQCLSAQFSSLPGVGLPVRLVFGAGSRNTVRDAFCRFEYRS
ncbi:hypothetical protein PHSY_001324 [Pseudozyma hubeiensis SY62]|uniref:Uncharacterized protein n=1 Tax=Pseudozyma hubeiensis (strain SY62) TaxID=1305764 RepID=R9NYI0_PSEHS|nr:hypothetical protein PHSY_001324 [Pseudozyma hubeiensis SY62]GAC93759.1 hypothetical protein PHSY_001324 [Pseudozyma hubeiensis SY62]